ncbi:hypothetical protein QLX08_003667 [Tetragonisca angustula]|uniref:Uncharacterized protein n=1 Tax=Tetragonisca angustula TaxID=166442 RepID=A0AAW1A5U0_9HYME
MIGSSNLHTMKREHDQRRVLGGPMRKVVCHCLDGMSPSDLNGIHSRLSVSRTEKTARIPEAEWPNLRIDVSLNKASTTRPVVLSIAVGSLCLESTLNYLLVLESVQSPWKKYGVRIRLMLCSQCL